MNVILGLSGLFFLIWKDSPEWRIWNSQSYFLIDVCWHFCVSSAVALSFPSPSQLHTVVVIVSIFHQTNTLWASTFPVSSIRLCVCASLEGTYCTVCLAKLPELFTFLLQCEKHARTCINIPWTQLIRNKYMIQTGSISSFPGTQTGKKRVLLFQNDWTVTYTQELFGNITFHHIVWEGEKARHTHSKHHREDMKMESH